MAWYDFIGDVFDWFDDNDWATDALGAILQNQLRDAPELDYEKLKEMAAQNALIQSPDQNTPTMISNWTVDPKTGERRQDLSYRPQFQALLDSLVNRAGNPIETYRAPSAMTEGLLGARINTLNKQSGLPEINYRRATFPTRPGIGGSVPGSTPPPTNPPPSGPVGPGNHPIHPPPNETGTNEDDQSTGGPGPAGNHGGYDPFDPSWDNAELIRDLTDRYSNYLRDSTGNFRPGSAPPQSFNDWLNENIGDNWHQGGEAEGWLLRNSDKIGKWLGRFAGLVSGIPGLGNVGEWLGNQALETYFQAHPGLVLSNPMQNPPADPLQGLWDSVANRNDPTIGVEGRSEIPLPARNAADAPGAQTGSTYGREGIGVGSRYGGRLGDSVFGGVWGDNYNGFRDSRDFASHAREIMQDEGLTWAEAVQRLINGTTGEDQRTP